MGVGDPNAGRPLGFVEQALLSTEPSAYPSLLFFMANFFCSLLVMFMDKEKSGLVTEIGCGHFFGGHI